MAIAVSNASVFERADRRALTDVLTIAARYALLVPIIGLVVGVHIHTLGYYFFGDDFLVLGDVRANPFAHYMRDVVLLEDMTPNWRPLTMAVYYGEHRLFGFDATAWRIVNLVVHITTVALLYELVLSMSKRVLLAATAALVFGVSASSVHTVTYITALPHVLSELLLIGSLYALHRYVEGGERRAGWYWASLALYVSGFLANEGGVVIGAVLLMYYALTSLPRRRDVLDLTAKMTPFALAGLVLVAGLAGSGRQGIDDGFYGLGWHIPRETWVYLSWLAYPVGEIPLNPSALEWICGSIVAAAAIFFVVRGPNMARIAAVGMVIAIMPYAPGKIWTATRYTYMATPFFAVLIAVGAGFVHGHAVRLSRPLAHAFAAVALVTIGGLYAWQTIDQTQPFLHKTDRWELLARELRENYPEAPAGTTIYVIDDEGLWTNAFWQPTWMASVGRALYGEDVRVRAVSTPIWEGMQAGMTEPVYLVEYSGGHLWRVAPASVTQAPD